MKNSPLKSSVDFKATQQAFTDYIRNPRKYPVPANVPKQRMAMYRELFFNNIESFLSNGFPVLRTLLSDAQWLALVDDFFANHHNQTPYFCEIAEEFLAYLETERDNPADYPFMLELAQYEWVEMALSIDQAELPPFIEYIDDFSQQQISLSPLAWCLAYLYPVHQISPAFLPKQPASQPTYLIVYRGWDDEVRFIQITAITFRLLQIIEEKPSQPVNDYLQQIAIEANQPNSELIMNAGLQTLQDLSQKSVIVLA